jgi:TetR/AcrR family transcriptional repressor of bet genes
MTTTAERGRPGPRRPPEKYDGRRDELAESALATLGRLGYANTSLRDIAASSEYSHGVLHYYFADKTELIIHGVRLYKARCVHRYDDIVAGSTTADHLRERFAAKLGETLLEEPTMHRLWYDLRNQSMFEADFRGSVQMIDATLEEMIWRVVDRYAELSGRPCVVASPVAYAMLDGIFEKAVLEHLEDEPAAAARLVERAFGVLPLMLGPAD